jgi:hypothetical protein
MKILPVGAELFHAEGQTDSRKMDGQTDRGTDRQTDMAKLIVAFGNSANAPKNVFSVQ